MTNIAALSLPRRFLSFEWMIPKLENILSVDSELSGHDNRNETNFKHSLEYPSGYNNLPIAVYHVTGLTFFPRFCKISRGKWDSFSFICN